MSAASGAIQVQRFVIFLLRIKAMPDMNEPYAHIQSEIDRLKYAEGEANREMVRLKQVAETHMMDRMKLETALDKQKKADEERKI